jgi:hypothetical protein
MFSFLEISCAASIGYPSQGRGLSVLLRCAGLALGLAFYTVIAPQAAHGATFPIQTWTAYCVGGENDDGQDFTDCSYQRTGGTTFEVLTQECNRTVSYEYNYVCRQTDHSNGNRSFFRGWCEASHLHPVQQQNGGWACTDEPPPPPECPIDPGVTQQVVSSSPLGSSACYSNCVMTTSSSGSVPWIEVNGVRRYFYDATSTGVYCEESDGAEPSEPWDEYTDEDGCYQGFDGRYCPGGGGGCPNSVTAPNGQTYCRAPETDESCNEAGGSTGDWYCGQDDPNYEEPSDSDGNADSDGDGIPNADDPYPEDPDADGDGTQDGEQDGDGNGIPDGEPGGIEDDGDGDSGNGEQGSHDGGTCEKGERREPDCSDDMDPTRCALAIELFHVRCDQELWRDDLKGTEEFNEDSDGDSLLDDSNEKNKVKKADIDVSEYFDGFDDSGFLQGSSSAPVLDFQFYGKSYQFDMTPFWDLAGMLGYLILAMAYFWAARIVAEGI